MEDPCWPMMTGPGRVDKASAKALEVASKFDIALLISKRSNHIKSMFIVFSHLRCFFVVCVCVYVCEC